MGARGSLWVYPDEGMVLAVMTNLTNADLVPMERELLALLLPGYEAPAAKGRQPE